MMTRLVLLICFASLQPKRKLKEDFWRGTLRHTRRCAQHEKPQDLRQGSARQAAMETVGCLCVFCRKEVCGRQKWSEFGEREEIVSSTIADRSRLNYESGLL